MSTKYSDKKELISFTPRPYYHYREISERTPQNRYFVVMTHYSVQVMERDKEFIELKAYTSPEDLRQKADLICQLLNKHS